MSVVEIGRESVHDGFRAGSGTVGTSEAKVSTVAFPIIKHIVVRANAANSGVIMVGPPGDAANGFILAGGEQTPPIYVNSTDKVALVGSEADQGFSWVAT